MRRYVLNRVLLGIVTIIGVSIIVFVVARLSGDVARLYAPTSATAEDLQAVRVRFGLDKPIPVQYLIFVRDALRGDFGTSFAYQRPAMEIVLNRLPATLQLGLSAFVIGNVSGCLTSLRYALRSPNIEPRSKYVPAVGTR